MTSTCAHLRCLERLMLQVQHERLSTHGPFDVVAANAGREPTFSDAAVWIKRRLRRMRCLDLRHDAIEKEHNFRISEVKALN